jgi:crotonobetainyl-CoA:carnitine CoA-transferase CaiB-like acyl-CoA transferase
MVQPFDGIRVVEFSEGMAGPMAGVLLADNGAEVIKVEPSGGDRARKYPGFLTWNRGKKSVVLDLDAPTERELALRLVLEADVLIESFRAGESDRRGLDYASLREGNPQLVHCSITGFGLADAHEHLQPYEAIVAAKSGRLMVNGPMAGGQSDGGSPIYMASPIGSYGAANLAVQGISAALLQRWRTGLGQRVETSLLDGLSAATMRLAFERQGSDVVPVQHGRETASLLQRGIALSFMTPECSDGRYIQMCARQPEHFKNWLVALGLADMANDPRFASLPFGLPSVSDAEEVEAAIRKAMRAKTQDEWMQIFVEETDVGGDPFLTPDEFLRHPQMVENGRVVVVDDPIIGPVTEVGPLVALEETPSVIHDSAPALGESEGALAGIIAAWRSAKTAGTANTADRATTAGGATTVTRSGEHDIGNDAPLSGLTILELASFLAAPLGSTLLAELGARVIKVEPLDGDPFRKVGLEFVHIGHGKESIAVDLKTTGGQEILHRLIKISDALIHNFRPGVPDRLGLDYEAVRTVNPDMVYLYGASYGSKGPQRHRAAFHSTPHALSGGGILQAGLGNPPVDDSYPDPCGGLAAGTALAMGLLARARFGTAQYLETTMLCSTGWVHSDRLTKYSGLKPLPVVDQQQRGLHALYRLYRCQTGWILLAALQQDEWTQLAHALDHQEWTTDLRYSSDAARTDNDAALIAELEGIFLTRAATEWETFLVGHGVPAASAGDYTFEEFLVQEQLVDSGEHHAFGTYWRLPPRVRFSRSANRLGRPAAVGEHTIRLLQEVGYGEDDIADLLRKYVVVAELEPEETVRV